ncbi:MAG: tripartite tricarboxylate transporter permease [Anaerolineae bacterium]|nr:tripartite tricarboxylate transporter permease [Anaerolineae bacterium]
MIDSLGALGAACAGTILASLLACVPGLHVYSVAGLIVVLGLEFGVALPGELLAAFMLGSMVGYAVVNTIPSIFWGAPDESTAFVVLPGQRFLSEARGYEAAVLTGVGSLGGLALLLALAPAAPRLLPAVRAVVAPHLHWILAAITLFMLMSEWPKSHDRARSPAGRLRDAWRSPGMGLLTFLLSGLLGMVLFYSSVLPPEVAFQNLMPAFTGLFAVPWVLGGLLAGVRLPEQQVTEALSVTPGMAVRGVAAGTLGGLLAAFFPAVTGGLGALIAGHATAQRDDRVFLVSQGASKLVYYVGALLLFFVPGLHLTRGGMASVIGAIWQPHGPQSYWTAVGLVVTSGALAFGLLLVLGRAAAAMVSRVDSRTIAVATLSILVALVVGLTGPRGLLVALPATGIGLIPVAWGARRTNCLGVILVPLTVQMAGVGPAAAGWLGLMG